MRTTTIMNAGRIQLSCMVKARLQHVRESNAFGLAFALLLIPFITVIVSCAGLMLGIAVNKWSVLFALTISSIVAYMSSMTRRGSVLQVLAVWGVCMTLLIGNSLSLVAPQYDDHTYHSPTTILLAKGWNPVLDAMPADIAKAMGIDPQSMLIGHVSTMAHAMHIFDAAMSCATGQVLTGSFFEQLMCIILGLLLWRVLPLWLPRDSRKKSFAQGLLILILTTFYFLFPGGPTDLLCGMFFAILVVSFEVFRRTSDALWLLWACVAGSTLCCVKLTGGLTATIVFLVYGASFACDWWKTGELSGLRSWWRTTACTVGLVGILGFSPYITNWVHYGSPLYPMHTFAVGKQQYNGVSRTFTTGCNDDARSMGYFGRFCYAYISKSVTLGSYRYMRSTPDFTPQWEGDVACDGHGVGFRVVMVLAITMIAMTRKWFLGWAIMATALASLVIPTPFVGYASYVPQIALIPMLISFNLLLQEKSHLRSALASGSLCIVAILALLEICHASVAKCSEISADCILWRSSHMKSVIGAIDNTSKRTIGGQPPIVAIVMVGNMTFYYHYVFIQNEMQGAVKMLDKASVNSLPVTSNNLLQMQPKNLELNIAPEVQKQLNELERLLMQPTFPGRWRYCVQYCFTRTAWHTLTEIAGFRCGIFVETWL